MLNILYYTIALYTYIYIIQATYLTYYTIIICYIGKGGGRIRKFSALTQTTITLR